jgi:release factor glutamine methyltransferase
MTHPQVYQPEADTYLLLEAVLSEIVPGERILEVGTGSGYIASRICGNAMVLATDINPHAVREARESGLEVARADLLEGIRGPFDLVIFNPPYLPTKEEERIEDWLEHALDGGKNGRAVISRFAGQVRRVLAPGGRVLILVSSLTGIAEVIALFRESGFHVRIIASRDVFGEDLLVIRCQTGGS